ncbi:MAG: HAMP domain-containing protein [Gammaproteobacteria bacterium]|nr:HAMP domain-containing protein [Gammaproteobacteria bacterium]
MKSAFLWPVGWKFYALNATLMQYMILKIRHKLFLAILFANMLLVLSIYLLGSHIFSTSFRDYLDASEAERLAPLVEELADIYAERGDWRWVRKRHDRLLSELKTKYGMRRPPPENGQKKPQRDGSPPRRPPPSSVLLLKDTKNRLLHGPPDAMGTTYWLPIEVGESLVGYLGFNRRIRITSELDKLFIARFKSSFVWMALGILLITSIISIPLARRLVKPIERLRQASELLASGDYRVRLDHNSRDEIGALTQDFNALAKTLSKNLSARQQWIADISHELRTPVAILQGEIEAVQDGLRALNVTTANSLHQEVIRLSRLIDDLHELSLSDMGALSYQKQTLDIVELVEAVIEQHRVSFDQHSISIHCKSSQPNIMVSADYQRLEQLFSNLAVNSRHYTASPGSVEVEIIKSTDQVILRWSDSKPGVSDDELLCLFERLYRVETSRNRHAGGSGLGLAICKNIAEASLGTITAEHSALGGISFVVTLPLK